MSSSARPKRRIEARKLAAPPPGVGGIPREPRLCHRWVTGGFTLIELLVSIALLALLLASVAAAINASLQSAAENNLLRVMTQSAGAAMDRITRDVRTAQAVDATSSSVTIIPPAGSDVDQIEYAASSGVLYYRRTSGGETIEYPLIGGTDDQVSVASFCVSSETGQDWQGLTCTKSVTVVMELTAGNNRYRITASAAPRRNQTY